jgi:hypothetical protein
MKPEYIQEILNRLYTDKIFRTEFCSDKRLFFSKYSIVSGEAVTFLEAISAEQVQFFSQGLLAKRFHAVKQLIPASIKLADHSLAEYWKQFSQDYLPSGIHKHYDDAIHFLLFLFSKNTKTDYFIKEVLRYEMLLLRNFVAPSKRKISYHRFDFVKEYRNIVRNDSTFRPLPKRTIIYWRSGKISTYKVLF